LSAETLATQTIGNLTICGERGTITITLHYLRRVFVVEGGRNGGIVYVVAAEIGFISSFFTPTKDSFRMNFAGLAANLRTHPRLLFGEKE